jgi:hypothetical protein
VVAAGPEAVVAAGPVVAVGLEVMDVLAVVLGALVDIVLEGSQAYVINGSITDGLSPHFCWQQVDTEENAWTAVEEKRFSLGSHKVLVNELELYVAFKQAKESLSQPGAGPTVPELHCSAIDILKMMFFAFCLSQVVEVRASRHCRAVALSEVQNLLKRPSNIASYGLCKHKLKFGSVQSLVVSLPPEGMVPGMVVGGGPPLIVVGEGPLLVVGGGPPLIVVGEGPLLVVGGGPPPTVVGRVSSIDFPQPHPYVIIDETREDDGGTF